MMKLAYVLAIFFLLVLWISYFQRPGFLGELPLRATDPEVFVGVDVAYNNLTKIRGLVEQISAYTNIFVIGCTDITYNETKLNEVCQYLYEKELFFIVYTERRPGYPWLEEAKNRWDKRFLGVYFWDENAGKQLDLYEFRAVVEADNYTDAADRFVQGLKAGLKRWNYTEPSAPTLFTSDYALYWYDYEAGYDVVLSQLGWNYSRQLNVALCRGAAKVHGKDWGVIITWTYNHPPYIESGSRLYEDMILAYNNGAKYILVFDSDEEYTNGILKSEHIEALKRFWQHVNNYPYRLMGLSNKVAYVLPDSYGFGFRGPNDKIWGIWEADELSMSISTDLSSKLSQFGEALDIIYDERYLLQKGNVYSQLIFWNGTIRNR